jgi:hypothetical protein
MYLLLVTHLCIDVWSAACLYGSTEVSIVLQNKVMELGCCKPLETPQYSRVIIMDE